MRKNILLKSTLRQLLRSLLLTLIIGIAAFFFVSRVAEYRIVVQEIERIGEHFRSIGHFSTAREEAGISYAAEFVNELDSPYIAFIDYNRNGFATLRDLHNITTGINHFSDMRTQQLRIRDRYIMFYGELVNIFGDFVGHAPRTILTFEVDTVAAGYPEWIVPGRTIEVIWRRDDGGSLALREETFAIGERYFIRAAYGQTVGFERQNLLSPINASVDNRLWAIHVPKGEEIDFTDPVLERVPDMLEILDVNHRSMRVWGSVDLTAKPQTQSEANMWQLRTGRWIDYEDHSDENPVAMIHWRFAEERNLAIGDTINLTLWDFTVRPAPRQALAPYSWGVRSGSNHLADAVTQEIAVEIVGTFAYQEKAPLGSHTQDIWVPTSILPDWFGADSHPTNLTFSFVLTCHTYQDAFYERYGEQLAEFGGGGVFYHFRFIEHGAEQFWETVEPIIESLFLNMILFTGIFLLLIVLIAFLYLRGRRREMAILRALGSPARRVVWYLMVPVIILWLPAVILGSVYARDFSHNAAIQTLASLQDGNVVVGEMFLDVTWLIAMAAITFGIVFLMIIIGAIQTIHRPVLLLLQGESTGKKKRSQAKKKASTIEIKGGGSEEIRNRDSEEMKVKRLLVKMSEDLLGATAGNAYYISDILFSLPRTMRNKRKGIWRYLRRQIRRAPLKSGVTIAVAGLSVFAFSWLQSAIDYNEAEIEYLWNNTIVEGHVRGLVEDQARGYTQMRRGASSRTVAAILETGFVDEIYLEAGYEFAYLVKPLADGSFPDDVWEGLRDEDFIDPYRNRMLAVTDLEQLVRDNTEERDFFGRRRSLSLIRGGNLERIPFEPLVITYAPGFDPSVFGFGETFDFEMTIPVILPQELMETLELELGDTVFFSHPFNQRRAVYPFTQAIRRNQFETRVRYFRIRAWTMTAEIVGMYTGVVHQPFAHDAILIPHGIMPAIRERLPSMLMVHGAYDTVRFTVDTARNRETETFREMLEEIVFEPGAGFGPIGFTLRDEDLVFVVQQLEQNLYLLRILYPIVIAISLVLTMGISVLLLLQNLKNVAIMRILGKSKRSITGILITKQMLVAVIGSFIGLIVVMFVGEIRGGISSILFMGLYFLATLAGSMIGMALTVNRSPLDLLQVKE